MRRTIILASKHFGPGITIEKLWGGWIRITTPTGGTVEISPKDGFRNHFGDASIHEAMVRFGGDAWGGLNVSGPPDYVLAMQAYGKAFGIRVTPKVQNKTQRTSTTVIALIFALAIFFMLWTFFSAYTSILWSAVVAGMWWHFQRRDQRRAEQLLSQSYQNISPDIHPTQPTANYEEARRKKLVL